MIYLFISIFCTCLIYLIFKLFDKYKIDVASGVVMNYLTCSVISVLMADKSFPSYIQDAQKWLVPFSILLGFSYVTTFTLLGRATILLGVSGGTIVSRMSMVLPAMFAIIFLGDDISVLKITGIFLALLAIYFTVASPKNNTGNKLAVQNLLIPVFAFIGVGMVDIMLKISQVWFIGNKIDTNFIALSYFAACAGSIVILAFSRNNFKRIFNGKTILLGTLLGVANYAGIYFFYIALTKEIPGSVIFPINSVGIVTISTLLALIFMGEKINKRKIVGIGLAVISILLISSS